MSKCPSCPSHTHTHHHQHQVSTPSFTTLSPLQLTQLSYLLLDYINIYKIIYFIDQVQADRFKSRNQYYFTIKHNQQHPSHNSQNNKHNCCSQSFNRIYSPRQEQSIYQRELEEMLSLASLKGGLLAEILNHCGKSFFRIKENGIKDGLPWDEENQVYLLGKTMEEGLLMFFVNKLKVGITEKQKVDSKQPMLYANAATWKARYPNIQLNFLKSDLIQSLCVRGYGIQKGYMQQDPTYILKQLNWIQKDGKFQQSLIDPRSRNDRTLWVSTVDQQSYPQTSKLLLQLSSIQFQINTKTNLGCSISQMYMISYYKQNGFHKKHQDSGVELDTGKKFTVILALERMEVTVWKMEGEGEKVVLEAKDLFVLKSRLFSYEIKCERPRSFVVRYWISGPKQPQA